MQPVEEIAARIHTIRGQRVMIDADLALLYGVSAKRFNEQVRRNPRRFPSDFMFRLENHEFAVLRSQFATSSWGGKRYLPFAFTEHGAIMAASVLNSPRAIEVSVFIVRAFVQLRNSLASHKELGKRLDELENRVGTHDHAVGRILEAIRQLTRPPDVPRRRRIGFL